MVPLVSLAIGTYTYLQGNLAPHHEYPGTLQAPLILELLHCVMGRGPLLIGDTRATNGPYYSFVFDLFSSTSRMVVWGLAQLPHVYVDGDLPPLDATPVVRQGGHCAKAVRHLLYNNTTPLTR